MFNENQRNLYKLVITKYVELSKNDSRAKYDYKLTVDGNKYDPSIVLNDNSLFESFIRNVNIGLTNLLRVEKNCYIDVFNIVRASIKTASVGKLDKKMYLSPGKGSTPTYSEFLLKFNDCSDSLVIKRVSDYVLTYLDLVNRDKI